MWARATAPDATPALIRADLLRLIYEVRRLYQAAEETETLVAGLFR